MEDDMSDYGNEEGYGWSTDDYNEMNEMKPEELPMETILEENSQYIHDSPPQNDTTKAPKKRKTSKNKVKKKAKTASSSNGFKVEDKLVDEVEEAEVDPSKKAYNRPNSSMVQKLKDSDAFLKRLYSKH